MTTAESPGTGPKKGADPSTVATSLSTGCMTVVGVLMLLVGLVVFGVTSSISDLAGGDPESAWNGLSELTGVFAWILVVPGVLAIAGALKAAASLGSNRRADTGTDGGATPEPQTEAEQTKETAPAPTTSGTVAPTVNKGAGSGCLSLGLGAGAIMFALFLAKIRSRLDDSVFQGGWGIGLSLMSVAVVAIVGVGVVMIVAGISAIGASRNGNGNGNGGDTT